jgi:transposase InsO family protein
MDEDAKKEIAVFRFGVINDLVGHRRLKRGEKEEIIREKISFQWDIPFSERSYISRSTIHNWVKRYEDSGRKLESLYPKDRKDKGNSRALNSDTVEGLINLKKHLDAELERKKAKEKNITIPALVTEALKRGIVSSDSNRSTIYRVLKIHGLDKGSECHDRRRFEAELPNDLWQTDVLHGPRVLIGKKMRKSYLILFLDDMSRLITHASFYPGEGLEFFLDALMHALLKRGLPRKIFLDNAPAFRSHHLKYITADLGIALINSTPRSPQTRGKVERLFRTVRMQLLSVLPKVLTLEELNAELWNWINNRYHVKKHSITGEAPIHRYTRHIYSIREAPKDITDIFRKRASRKVKKDRTVNLNGNIYECPVELISKSIRLLYHDNDPSRIEAFYMDKSYGFLTPLDPVINSVIKREKNLPYKTGKLFDLTEKES